MTVHPVKDMNQIANMIRILEQKGNRRDPLLLKFGLNTGLRINDILRMKVKYLFNPDVKLKEYLVLFEKYFLKSFTSRLTDYSEPKIEVLSAEVLNPKYTIVRSLLLATDKKPEVKIEWRVYTKNPDKPLIRDLIIEGLSLARTQKEEFASVIESNNGDVTKLFITLKEFVAK